MGLCLLGLHDADSENLWAAEFEFDLWERLRWRAGEDGAVGGGEDAAVAGAVEFVVFGAVEDRAGMMGAEAAERKVGVCGGAKQEAGALVSGVGEDFGAADGEIVGLGDEFCRERFFSTACGRDEGRGDGYKAGSGEGFCEFAAGGVSWLRVFERIVHGREESLTEVVASSGVGRSVGRSGVKGGGPQGRTQKPSKPTAALDEKQRRRSGAGKHTVFLGLRSGRKALL